MSRVIIKHYFAYVKKAQISCAVTLKLISAFVFAREKVPKTNNHAALSCVCETLLVSDVVGTPNTDFLVMRLTSYRLTEK